jgi:hypothetical protein
MDFCRSSGKRSGSFPPLGAAGARSCPWKKRFVLGIEWRVREVKMDFPLNPFPEFPHRRGLGLLILEDGCGVPMMRKAFLQGAALVVRLLCGGPHQAEYF